MLTHRLGISVPKIVFGDCSRSHSYTIPLVPFIKNRPYRIFALNENPTAVIDLTDANT